MLVTNSTLSIHLIPFGIARDLLPTEARRLSWQEGMTLGQVRAALLERVPALAALRSLRFAVNEAYQDDDFVLREGDEVVIIPPVSGG